MCVSGGMEVRGGTRVCEGCANVCKRGYKGTHECERCVNECKGVREGMSGLNEGIRSWCVKEISSPVIIKHCHHHPSYLSFAMFCLVLVGSDRLSNYQHFPVPNCPFSVLCD